MAIARRLPQATSAARTSLRAYPLLLLGALVALNAMLVVPEVLKERIYPWDDALYAANGAFFLSVFQSLPAVLQDPMGWTMEYFGQYPALFIRRQPPLFGVAESAIYAVFGISAVTAKLTVLLFSTAFVVGWFLALQRWTKSTPIAFLATLLTVTLPMTVQLSTSVRTDIPALALFVWALYVYSTYQEQTDKRVFRALLIAALLATSLYIYQLPLFGVAALFAYMAVSQWPAILRRRDAYVLAGVFGVLMLPLAAFTIKFAFDNVAGVVGKQAKDFEIFTPVASKESLDYWTYYLALLWNDYRMPTLGIGLWLATKVRVPFRSWETFLLSWIVTAYLGFSLIPSKGDRYAFYFVLPMLPLVATGIVDLASALARGASTRKLLIGVLGAGAVTWNVISIPDARIPLTTGFDEVTREIVSAFPAASVLYHGRFESAFIYYMRKNDAAGRHRVLRTGNEIARAEELKAALRHGNVNVLVIQQETPAVRESYSEIYRPLYQILQETATDPSSRYRPWKEFRIQYGVPGKERDVILKVLVPEGLSPK